MRLTRPADLSSEQLPARDFHEFGMLTVMLDDWTKAASMSFSGMTFASA
jgi:hypothetical protein